MLSLQKSFSRATDPIDAIIEDTGLTREEIEGLNA